MTSIEGAYKMRGRDTFGGIPVVEIKAELDRIHAKHGDFTPAIVLDEWKSKRSKFHTLLQWDQQAAAESWRIHQVRAIVASIEWVPVVREERPQRAIWSVRTDDGPRYMPRDRMFSSSEWTAQQARSLMVRLETLRAQYQDVIDHFDLVGIGESIERLKQA